MIHPTRTNLLERKEKARSVDNSIRILKAKRQALIRELLQTVDSFRKSRQEIQSLYRRGLEELHLSLGLHGSDVIASIAAVSARTVGVDLIEKNILGVKVREITAQGAGIRSPEERNYDYAVTTPHLEEAAFLFEQILLAILETATYENMLKRLGSEILRVTRRIRVLEERLLPILDRQIRTIAQHLEERDREADFRLRRFKRTAGRRKSAGGAHALFPDVEVVKRPEDLL